MLQRPPPPQVLQKRHRVERDGARLHQKEQQEHVLPLVARVKKLRYHVRSPGGGGWVESGNERQGGGGGGDVMRIHTQPSVARRGFDLNVS